MSIPYLFDFRGINPPSVGMTNPNIAVLERSFLYYLSAIGVTLGGLFMFPILKNI